MFVTILTPEQIKPYCDRFQLFLQAHDNRRPNYLLPYSQWLQEMLIRCVCELHPDLYQLKPYEYRKGFHTVVKVKTGQHVGGILAWADMLYNIRDPIFINWLREQVQKPDCFRIEEVMTAAEIDPAELKP